MAGHRFSRSLIGPDGEQHAAAQRVRAMSLWKLRVFNLC